MSIRHNANKSRCWNYIEVVGLQYVCIQAKSVYNIIVYLDIAKWVKYHNHDHCNNLNYILYIVDKVHTKKCFYNVYRHDRSW